MRQPWPWRGLGNEYGPRSERCFAPAQHDNMCLLRHLQFLERSRLAFDGGFRGQPFDAGGAEEAGNAFGVLEDVLRILRLGDRAAVAEHEDVGVGLLRRVADRLHLRGRLLDRQRRVGADRLVSELTSR